MQIVQVLPWRGRQRDSLTSMEKSRSAVMPLADGAPSQQGNWQFSSWILGTKAGQWTVLLLFGVFLIAAGTIAWRLTPGTEDFPADTLYQSLWMSYTLWADVGTQTGLTASDPRVCTLVAIFFSFCGFVYNLALLGLVVDVIRGQLEYWKRAKSRVDAKGHVLILGWGDKTLYLLNELIGADQNCDSRRYFRRRPRRQIVILADRSVHDMSQDVRTYFCSRFKSSGLRGNLKCILYRQGDPTDQAELLKVSAPYAEDILVMGICDDSGGSSGIDGSDEHVMQTLLALAALNLEFRLSGDVFAEMQTHDSVRVMNDIFPMAEGVVARHAVNRMLVLRTLLPPVGFVFLEMVSFSKGSELYVRDVPPALVGVPFQEACCLFPFAVLCGVCNGPRTAALRLSQTPTPGLHGSQKYEMPCLIPQGSRLLEPGDKLVILASTLQDADHFQLGMSQTTRPSMSYKVRRSLSSFGLRPATVEPCTPARTLMLRDSRLKPILMADGQLRLGPSAAEAKVTLMIGCPVDFPDFLQILDCYLAGGSEVHVLSSRSGDARTQDLRRFYGDPRMRLETDSCFKRIRVLHHFGPPTCTWALSQLPLERADYALILSESHGQDHSPLAADSKNLTSVINLRSLMPKDRSKKKCKVVTELTHPKSSLVVEGNNTVRRHGSFVYSTSLETGVFALAAEEKTVCNILMQILEPTSHVGHIIVAPIENFVRGRESLSYLDLHARVMQSCDGVLLGWRRAGEHYPDLNPRDKTEEICWTDAGGDELLILCPHSAAEEEDDPWNVTRVSSVGDDDHTMLSPHQAPVVDQLA